MLEAIRKRSSGIIVKGLLGLLVLSFAMWGVADVVSPGGSGDRAVATVGDVEIDDYTVRQEYRREIERLSGIFGKRLETEDARAFGIPENVLSAIIDRTLYDAAATNMGLVVSDELVRQTIHTIAGFKNEKGEFQRNLFDQVLQNNGLSEAAFVRDIRLGVKRAQYLSLLKNPPKAPSAMTKAMYSFRNEKRIAETISIDLASITDTGSPSQADLEKFHKDNGQRYTAPEYRSLTLVRLSADELAKEIAVSDDEIARLYEDRIDEYMETEQRNLQQVRVADEADAKKIHERLNAGEDFAKVAKDLAGMEGSAIELGNMTKAQLPPELGTAAFALVPGAFSAPVNSPLGWHIVKLTSVKAASQKALSEVSDALKKDIATEKAIDSLYQLANTLEDQLGSGDGVNDAARALGLKPVTIAAIDTNGFDADGNKVMDIPGSKFMTVAFATEEGGDSALEEDGSDGYYVVHVDGVTAPSIRPIGKVVKQVSDDWTQSRRAETAQKTADEILERLKAGGDLFRLASERGLKVTTSAPFTRGGDLAGLPAQMVTELFKAAPGDAVSTATDKEHVIGRLKQVDAIAGVADEKAKKNFEAIANELGKGMRDDLLEQLAQGLRQRYPVTVNSKALNELF